jgi:hypothetical protein
LALLAYFWARFWRAFQPENDLAFCASLKGQEQSDADQEHDCYD